MQPVLEHRPEERLYFSKSNRHTHHRSGVQHCSRCFKYLILARYFDGHSRSRCAMPCSFQITPVTAKFRDAGHLNKVVRSDFCRSRKWKSGRMVCHLPLDERADCRLQSGRNYPAGYVNDSQNSCISWQTLSSHAVSFRCDYGEVGIGSRQFIKHYDTRN